MSWAWRKTRFYIALHATRLGLARARFAEMSGEPTLKRDMVGGAPAPHRLRIHFLAPIRTAGANVIIHDMLPTLLEEVRTAGLDWHIEVSSELPREAVDWLVCFKTVPDTAKVIGQPRTVLLICDQVELFWHQLDSFDEVVATASRTLAKLLAAAHPRVTFIGESEPLDYLAFGAKNLATPPAQRGHVLMWHGGAYSLDALQDLRPALENFAQTRTAGLHIISGKGEPREEQWGKLNVKFLPWSKDQLFRSAAQARLGFVPARSSVRLSWLKPGSRVRCLYSLGVPTIGDARVPDAARFLGEFGGPVAHNSASWSRLLSELWDAPERLAQLAADGQAAVASGHSTKQTARQWIRYFGKWSAE